MLRVMVRPRWVLALLLALAIAAAFALLGQWQLERAVTSAVVTEQPTETAVPLTGIVQPNQATTQKSDGQLMTVEGYFNRDDYDILTGRYNGGEPGYWVVGHFTVSGESSAAATEAGTSKSTGSGTGGDSGESAVDSSPAGLAVALGWTPGLSQAESAAAELSRAAQPAEPTTITGRYLATEAPIAPKPGEDPSVMTTMSVAALINLWHDFDDADADVYGGYLVSHQPPASLEKIDSMAPVEGVNVNWLNIFYAAEWAIFAGFAVFLWYRLVKDAWEREQELARLSQGP